MLFNGGSLYIAVDRPLFRVWGTAGSPQQVMTILTGPYQPAVYFNVTIVHIEARRLTAGWCCSQHRPKGQDRQWVLEAWGDYLLFKGAAC